MDTFSCFGCFDCNRRFNSTILETFNFFRMEPKMTEGEDMEREERTIGGLSDRLDKYIALQLAALEARLVAEFQPKIDALHTDAAALEAATARAVAAEGRVKKLNKELAITRDDLAAQRILFVNMVLAHASADSDKLSDANARADAFKNMLLEAGLDPSQAPVILAK